MSWPLALPQWVDIVILITVLEFVALVAHHRLTRGGLRPGDFALNLVSGLCLMLALRSVVRDQDVVWTVLCLLAAGAAHGADIWLRWSGSAGKPHPVASSARPGG